MKPRETALAIICVLGAACCLMAGGGIVGGFVMRGCQRAPIASGIDAGPGDRAIAAELDGAVRREQARIEALIAEQQGELAALRAEDAAEFDAAKRRGREALAAWFAGRMPDGGRL